MITKYLLSIILVLASSFLKAQDWEKTYSITTSSNSANNVIQTSDSGFVVAATSSVIKINKSGDVEWVWLAGTSHNAYYVNTCTDGNYIVGTGKGLTKLSASGDTLWQKEEPFGDFSPYFVTETSDGGFIVGGIGQYAGPDVAKCYKTNSSGDTEWTYTTPKYCVCSYTDIIEDADGNFIASGWGAYLLKISPTGTQIWEKDHIGIAHLDSTGLISLNGRKITRCNSNFDTLWVHADPDVYYKSILKTSDGYIVSGMQYNDSTTSGRVAFQKFSLGGKIVWQKQFGNSDSEGNHVIILPGNEETYLIAGRKLNGSTSTHEAYLIKTTIPKLLIPALATTNTIAVPNPTSTLTQIYISEEFLNHTFSIRLVNSFGIMVQEINGTTAPIAIDLTGLPLGIYSYTVTGNNGTLIGTGKIIKAP